ncbi:MAG: antibiotic biosynthesis monooxygenase family protein [Jatrophihabitans sp.]|uniref:antibiotic biosynthesis monooxygenase family protein n=1 Tax=Jatrophihabitans sp. TaxID=1932789 RepID=UPI003F80AD65
MIAIAHLQGDDLVDEARRALTALAGRPGYLRGSLGRSTDDPTAWVLVTEWENVGSYRRALGNFDVKVGATPLLAGAADLPGAFETLVDVAPGGVAVAHRSDRTPVGEEGRTAP